MIHCVKIRAGKQTRGDKMKHDYLFSDMVRLKYHFCLGMQLDIIKWEHKLKWKKL
jgi:hypothetical protein